MPKQAMELLTEAMFYTLLALDTEPMCGTDIAAFTRKLTQGRVRLGPATLYTLLGKFEKEDYIRETQVDGRKRIYEITQSGKQALYGEVRRLRSCLFDAERAGGGKLG